MSESFYWYDLETTGTNPKWDRIIQFAGVRTDTELNIIDDPKAFYVRLSDDVLPNPEASLVTGISPSALQNEGVFEKAGLDAISEELSVPGTCTVGYNNLRFDDEFLRYGFFRNFVEPYAREWKNGNSRFDVFELVRAAGALRREGINWPLNDDGTTSYRLEAITQLNNIDHGNAHDALSDVFATIGLARLIRREQPRLFDYYLSLRDKRRVKKLLEPFGQVSVVFVSALNSREKFNVAPVLAVGLNPLNSNSVIAVDLSLDIDPLLEATSEEIRHNLLTASKEDRYPIRDIRLNKCPFVATKEVVHEEANHYLKIDWEEVENRRLKLQGDWFSENLLSAFSVHPPMREEDPDASLYDGFLSDQDVAKMEPFNEAIKENRWLDTQFTESRLNSLASRLKARSFPHCMSESEQRNWGNFVRNKLTSDGPWLGIDEYFEKIGELSGNTLDRPDTSDHLILEDLMRHGRELASRYQINMDNA